MLRITCSLFEQVCLKIGSEKWWISGVILFFLLDWFPHSLSPLSLSQNSVPWSPTLMSTNDSDALLPTAGFLKSLFDPRQGYLKQHPSILSTYREKTAFFEEKDDKQSKVQFKSFISSVGRQFNWHMAYNIYPGLHCEAHCTSWSTCQNVLCMIKRSPCGFCFASHCQL